MVLDTVQLFLQEYVQVVKRIRFQMRVSPTKEILEKQVPIYNDLSRGAIPIYPKRK